MFLSAAIPRTFCAEWCCLKIPWITVPDFFETSTSDIVNSFLVINDFIWIILLTYLHLFVECIIYVVVLNASFFLNHSHCCYNPGICDILSAKALYVAIFLAALSYAAISHHIGVVGDGAGTGSWINILIHFQHSSPACPAAPKLFHKSSLKLCQLSFVNKNFVNIYSHLYIHIFDLHLYLLLIHHLI